MVEDARAQGKSRVPVKIDGLQHLWWLNNNVVVSIEGGQTVPVSAFAAPLHGDSPSNAASKAQEREMRAGLRAQARG